jgi:DegV family protein with EDD domain
MAKIKFLTDSASDIPKQYVEQYDIQVIPFPIALKDREILDGVDYTPEEFYSVLLAEEKIPSHAQINTFQFEEIYEQAYADGYDALIYTCINFKGSNTGNNALMARKNFYTAHPEAEGKFELYIIDSKCYTYAYGYAVVEAAKKAQSGDLTAAEAAAQIQDWVDHVKIVFTPYDLKFARKSGRVSAAAAIMGGAMGIRPIMSFPDGESKVLAKPRGDKAVVSQMVKLLTEEMEPGSPYLLIKSDSGEHSAALAEACQEAVGYAAQEEFLVGGVIVINAGPSLFGVIYRTKS